MSIGHALLSASSSHKWLHCPPSARLEDQFPDTAGEAAQEGRLAHALAELKLRKHFTPLGPRKFNAELKKLQEDPLYKPEMLDHADTYLDYVQKVCHAFDAAPHVAIERRVDYSVFAPEGFGTADCIVIGSGILHVIDYKYGQGVPVEAERNPQMMLYGLGALNAYAMLYEIHTVRMTIVQPRIDRILEDEIEVDKLLAWGDGIRSVAQQAFEGKGEFCPGVWCKDAFCKARKQCRAYNEQYRATITALEAFAPAKPPLITNEELGEILARAEPIAAWVKELKEYAEQALLNGEEVPGYKLVEGRTSRVWKDGTDEAFRQLMERGIEEALLWKREPVTPPALEKALGKKPFKETAEDLVETMPGKPTLVPESDKREPIKLSPTAAEVFANPA